MHYTNTETKLVKIEYIFKNNQILPFHSPNAVAPIQSWALHIWRLVARTGCRRPTRLLHATTLCCGSCRRCCYGRGSTAMLQHFMAVACHCRRTDLHIFQRIALGQATARSVAVLQPHGVCAVLGLDFGVGLRVRE